MSLNFLKPPPDAAKIFEKAVMPTSSAGHFIAKLSAKNGAADVAATKLSAQGPGVVKNAAEASQFSKAHQIYSMRLNELAQGAGLNKARPLGWRYLKTDDRQSPISEEVYMRREENKPAFAQVSSGPYCQSTLSAFATAEKNPDVQGSRYEPRLLHVPALSLQALWLQKRTANLGEQDLFLPLVPMPSFLVGKFYSTGEFLGILQRAAQARLSESQPRAEQQQQRNTQQKNQ